MGGLSGRALTKRSTALIGDMFKLTEGKVPIIGNNNLTHADTQRNATHYTGSRTL
jgi:dihydroorotate dehydrogenase